MTFRGPFVLFGIALGATGLLLTASAGDGLMRSDSKVKITVEASKPDASGKQTITLAIQVEKGWHIHANPVNNKGLEANKTTVAVYAGKKEVAAKVDYPAGTTEKMGDESLSVYTGLVKVPVYLTRDGDAKEPLTFIVRVSACDDSRCLLPGEVLLKVP